jgi:hypothetical protein
LEVGWGGVALGCGASVGGKVRVALGWGDGVGVVVGAGAGGVHPLSSMDAADRAQIKRRSVRCVFSMVTWELSRNNLDYTSWYRPALFIKKVVYYEWRNSSQRIHPSNGWKTAPVAKTQLPLI